MSLLLNESRGPTRGAFPLTRWTMVRRAVAQPQALEEWVGLYWYPLYVWARRRGASEADAADGVQSFLLRLCEKALLAQAEENRGRLRSWLLTAFGNHLASEAKSAGRKKRGGGVEHVAVDWAAVEAVCESHSAASPGGTPEQAYARAWALTLMDEALDRVEAHYRKTERAELFAALLPALEDAPDWEPQAQIAARMSMSAAAVRQAAQRLRQRYRRTLLDVAAQRLGMSGDARVGAEIRGMLGGGL